MRQRTKCILVQMKSKPKLLQIVGARHAASGFAGVLNRRQEQCHQHANDGNHDEQLYERKAKPFPIHAKSPNSKGK